jgi:hypothetical protein
MMRNYVGCCFRMDSVGEGSLSAVQCSRRNDLYGANRRKNRLYRRVLRRSFLFEQTFQSRTFTLASCRRSGCRQTLCRPQSRWAAAA